MALGRELDTTMALCGLHDIREVTRGIMETRDPVRELRGQDGSVGHDVA